MLKLSRLKVQNRGESKGGNTVTTHLDKKQLREKKLNTVLELNKFTWLLKNTKEEEFPSN